MKKYEIELRLHTLSNFSDRALAEEVLGHLLSLPEMFRPFRAGTYTGQRFLVNEDSRKRLVDGWLGIDETSPDSSFKNVVFFVETRSGASYMVRWPRDSKGLSTFEGEFVFPEDSVEDSKMAFLGLADDLATKLRPAFGVIQDPTSKAAKIPYNLDIRLPDIPPVSIMGSTYVDFFGRERLLQAPYLEIVEREYGMWLEASEDVFVEVPEERRKAIREFLGEDCFMALPRQRYKYGRAPTLK